MLSTHAVTEWLEMKRRGGKPPPIIIKQMSDIEDANKTFDIVQKEFNIGTPPKKESPEDKESNFQQNIINHLKGKAKKAKFIAMLGSARVKPPGTEEEEPSVPPPVPDGAVPAAEPEVAEQAEAERVESLNIESPEQLMEQLNSDPDNPRKFVNIFNQMVKNAGELEKRLAESTKRSATARTAPSMAKLSSSQRAGRPTVANTTTTTGNSTTTGAGIDSTADISISITQSNTFGHIRTSSLQHPNTNTSTMIGRRKDLRQGSPKPYGRYEGRGLPERKAETGKRDLDTKEEVKGRVPPLPERMRRQEETTAPTIPVEEGETTDDEEEEPQEEEEGSQGDEDSGRSKH